MFSFFYINETNNYLVNNSDLLEVINDYKGEYEIKAVDAVINGEYIIPGIKGKSVNILESYYKMSPYDIFSETFLVYDEITPSISISNNLDKYIESGNSVKRNIALIIDENTEIENFLITNNITANKLVTLDNYNLTSLERINNELVNFTKLGNIIDNKICLVNEYNEYLCKENNYYLIKPNIYASNDNYNEIKNNLSSGQIIYITNELDLIYFESLYIEILFRGYNLVSLLEIIEE